ncbi:RodZ domain-containing protein [Paenibacillus cisolokensis]|uniref:helix-turn-helix domain-containing protein n=1 Tax=Paenibacillus cisolokensis TaxID=1658519 RepID=UPI003D29C725
MSELGAELRRARLERGLTLDDVQDSTKIRKRYLEAIEEGNYNVLPGNFYVRAFVKNYCEAVGLDADQILSQYGKEIPSASLETETEPSIAARPPRRSQPSQRSERFGKVGFSVLMWSFLILILILVYVFAIRKDSPPPKTADNNTSITDEVKPPSDNGTDQSAGEGQGTGTDTQGTGETAEPETEPEKPATTVTFREKEGNIDHYDVAPAGDHKLEIVVTNGQSWIEVREERKGGKARISKTVDPDNTLTYDLDKPLYVNVGRADNVEIKIDDIVVDDGNRPNSKKIIFHPIEDGSAANETGQSGTGGEGR